MKRLLAIVAVFLVLGWGAWKWSHRGHGPEKASSEEFPLFSGKEPKAPVKLYFPASNKPGFSDESSEIYLTQSKGAQVKQLLQQLFRGPKSPSAAPAFPKGFRYREVFVTDKGLAVIDLDPESVKSHPGGTSSEFVSLYCLTRSVLENFKDIKQVQLLVGGQARESLAGHFDISEPLTLQDF